MIWNLVQDCKNIQIQTIKDLKFKHNYSNLFANLKTIFKIFLLSQLSKKPFSPWFSKIRKLSVVS